MPKKIRSLFTYIFTFALCAFLVWLSVRDIQDADMVKIKSSIQKANYLLLIPIVTMGMISHWSRAVRWKYLMEPLQMFPSTANTFFAVMIGYLANMFLPRFGEIIKCTILAKYEKLPVDKMIGTIITERAFDLLCLLLIFVITILLQIDLAKSYITQLVSKLNQSNNNDSSTAIYWWLSIAFLAIIGLIFRKKIVASAFFQKIKLVARNILSGIGSFQHMPNKKGFVFHTVLIWTMYLGMIVLGFQSIAETNMLSLKPAFSVLSFGSLGMIATPGGIGAYTLLVEEIVSLYGVDKAISVAISWIIWLVPTLIILFGGAISLFLIPIINKSKSHVE